MASERNYFYNQGGVMDLEGNEEIAEENSPKAGQAKVLDSTLLYYWGENRGWQKIPINTIVLVHKSPKQFCKRGAWELPITLYTPKEIAALLKKHAIKELTAFDHHLGLMLGEYKNPEAIDHIDLQKAAIFNAPLYPPVFLIPHKPPKALSVFKS